MLKCEQIAEKASAYVDGELGFWAALQYRLHLAMCRPCLRFVRQFRRTIEMVRRLPCSPVEQAKIDAVAQRLDSLEKRESPPG
ncbi:anti-sigma factor [Motiliproteus sp. SC1-56]|uniref:anti-sigma factor family protein n=1 Tax=Motiliproteus sp. SC1-56 TaxID=2799565 RepID=UPI001A8F62A1|nr:zf-HC2 domain-containing protein [Motiliproteus sp. SC1-56]